MTESEGSNEGVLARSLATLGVGADDIAVISKHDTSTLANDPNETELHERLADSMGRSAGAPLFVVSQKSLTGHAQGIRHVSFSPSGRQGRRRGIPDHEHVPDAARRRDPAEPQL